MRTRTANQRRDKMKSRTIEIIDNHIKALEEELEWYQEKNREWQEKCEKLENKLDILEANRELAKHLNFSKSGQIQELRNENARLREQLRWHDAKKEPPNKSGHYIVMTTLGLLALMYYNYTSTYGWNAPGIVSKWCYIPDDNRVQIVPKKESE